ncbi:T9SS type A sorting domain-containing protein, partial [Polaribacter aestuariivivens]
NYWIYTNQNDPAAADDRSSNYVRVLETEPIGRARGYTMKSTGVVGQNYTFVGTPNDGTISFPLTGETASLVGNPYPSVIDATDFINTNINTIEGTLYFWEHTGEDVEPTGISGHTFAGYYGGYGQRNLTMGIAANGTGSIGVETFDFTSATETGNVVSQVVDGVTISIENSNDSAGILSGIFNIIGQGVGNLLGGVSEYEIEVSFDKPIDLKSIFLLNSKSPLSPINPTVTLTPNKGTPVTQTLTGILGQDVNLNWEDVTSFTITTDSPYNLVMDNLEFTQGLFPSLGDAIYTAPSRYIAVAQGFFVRADSDGGTLRFENSQRNYKPSGTSENTSYFFKSNAAKNKKQNEDEDEIDLLPVIKLGYNRTSSNAVALHRQIGISFRRGNTFKYENGYDSEIFDVGDNDIYWQFPELADRKLVIAGVSEITNQLEVPLTIAVANDDKKTIQIDEIRNINRDVYLLDKVTNIYYTLTKTPQELNIPAGTYTDRFYIVFSKQSALNTENFNPIDNEVTVFADNSNKEIVIKNNNNLKIENVEIFNILGQKIKKWNSINSNSENRLNVKNLSATIYIIKIKTEKGTLSKKVLIE